MHVRRMRAAYRERQDFLLQGIAQELGGIMQASPTEAGMHLVGWLSDRTKNDARVSAAAWDAGVEAAPLSRYTIESRLRPGLLLGFAAVRPPQMLPALMTLRKAIMSEGR